MNTTDTPVQTRKKSAVGPFAIRADHRRNADLLLASIPNCRLRSTIKGNRPVVDRKTGEQMVPLDQSAKLGALPEIPGMELHVNPAQCTYRVVDPLHTDEELCERIRRRINQTNLARMEKLQGVPPQEGKLDIHRMKTLVRECIWLLDAGDAEVIKGATPIMADADDLQGEYLLNPGARTHNTQPRFEKDWDEWVAQLTRAGG